MSETTNLTWKTSEMRHLIRDYILRTNNEFVGELIGRCRLNRSTLICFFKDVESGMRLHVPVKKIEGKYCAFYDDFDFSRPDALGKIFFIHLLYTDRGNDFLLHGCEFAPENQPEAPDSTPS